MFLVRVICICELDPTNPHTMQTHAPEHLNALWTQLRVTTAVIFTITAGEIYSAIWQFLAVVEQVSCGSYPRRYSSLLALFCFCLIR